jgi:hypothetical protein
MRRALVTLFALLLLPGCYRVIEGTEELFQTPPRSGRELVSSELEPPQLVRKSSPLLGILTTGLSSIAYLFGLDHEQVGAQHGIRFQLVDGTLVGGLFFPWEGGDAGPKPLLIASFGFLQDRFGTEAAKFHDFYVKSAGHRLPAHVLILDHPTAGIFLGNNGTLSPGSYDDGRMWIEVTRILREEMDLASVHLFGVSMSGQSVVHALIEDARLGLGLFESGVAVSIAPDFAEAPGRQFAEIRTDEGVANPWREIAPDTEATGEALQVQAMRLLVDHQFLPGYRRVHPRDAEEDLPTPQIPVLFWDRFEERLAFLRSSQARDWNPDFSHGGLPDYLGSTRIADVIDRVQTPLVLLSAKDDPAVRSDAFQEVASAAAQNPWVLARETPEGGHFGFDVPYGAGYLEEVIELMIDPNVLANWREGPR